ncbi:MAG: AMP-binding protein [Clostridiales bacterium]|nr:AMP-binding protein [Clostridiales bacterium]
MRDVNEIINRVGSNSDFSGLLLSLKERYAGQTLFVYENENNESIERTYAEFVDDVMFSANWINDHIREKENKHLAAFVKNDYEYIVLYSASLCGAGVFILIDDKLEPELICDNLKALDVDLIIADSAFSERLKEDQFSSVSGIECINISEMVQERARKEQTSLTLNFVPKSPDELHVIVPTSGTLSKFQKYVMLSATNFISCVKSNIEAGVDTYRYKNEQKVLSVLPLVHVFALMANVLLPICCGDQVILSKGLENLASDLLKYNPTSLCVVPLIAEGIMRKYVISKKNTPELESSSVFGTDFGEIMLAGANVSEDLVKAYDSLGYNVMRAYGMSEATANVITSFQLNRERDYKTLGHAMPGIEIKTIDGEICVKGKNVMLGYYKNEELTKQTIVDGWLKTGDAGYISDNGRVYFSGRKKSVIVLNNGENIIPEEIEEFFSSIDDIEECVVYTKEDKKLYFLGRTSKSFTEYDDILYSLQVKNRELPYGKQVHKFILTDNEIPKTGSGKIMRSSLKQFVAVNEIQMDIKKIVDSMLYTKVDIRGESSFKNDLELSSFDMMVLWTEICKKFSIEMPKKVIMNYNCIADISNYVAENA